MSALYPGDWDRSLGCPYISGPACSDCTGSCWEPQPQGPPEPTAAEYCEGTGHPPYGFDPASVAVRCYCGVAFYDEVTGLRMTPDTSSASDTDQRQEGERA